MKIKLFFLCLFLTTVSSGCSTEKKLPSEEILSTIVTGMCKKMISCQPKAIPSEEVCQTTMKKALEGQKEAKSLAATQKQLDSCLTGIAKSDCEELLGSKPPEGCEFLK